MNLTVELAGLKLQNPVMPASGTFGFGEEYASYVDLNALGALVTKSITLEPRLGNPPPRIVETPAGLLNSIGLQNPGLEAFIREKMPFLRRFRPPIIVNIAGSTVDEYAELARRLGEVPGVAALEVNISCPNVKEGGMAFGSEPEQAAEVIQAVRRVTTLPIIAKLTPNVTDIVAVAQAVERAGADALSLINTLVGMAVDWEKRRPVLGNIVGGLSGPAIKPIALYAVWRVARSVKIPVIGMGGIMTATDALEFLLVGARAVAVGTANLVSPQAMLEIIEGLREYLMQNNIDDINKIIGSLELTSPL
ncbi:dihydroorotate oxidase B, catalytic subunit [Thermanaeromonas toyohensis ToBE]|uniref:Dihydroorotate dehydrogenase n=1 Tax=Thermanaeromonas toyohensis ToBE TaxID=698762 RepID=A0A1W1W390_9FIRM|nr:dihydroorotate dehydrogenase [Thermanaeromonas toyohensis]SMB99920.1 dihydroorotate oxidase B, catalytic subunit [Thermanaeromonas toyohensis ToBE]